MRTRTIVFFVVSAALISACNDKMAPVAGDASTTGNSQHSSNQPQAAVITAWEKPAAAVPHTALCNIDAINGAVPTPAMQADRGKPMSISGWVSTANLKNPGKFDLVFEGGNSYKVSSTTNTQRPDVAAGYKSADLGNAGFTLDLPSIDVEPGTYHLSLQHQGVDSATLCDAKIDLTIK